MDTVTTITAPGTGSRPKYGTVEYFTEMICMGFMPEPVRPPVTADRIDRVVLALLEDMAGPDAKYLGSLADIRNLIAAAKQLRDGLAGR